LTLAYYKFAHFTLKMSPHYLVKCKKKSIRESSWLRHGASSSRAWWIIDQRRTRLETCVQTHSGHFEQALFRATYFFPKKSVD